MVNYITRYFKNKPKPEMAHKTGTKSNFEKICRQKLRSEERITCVKFQKFGGKKVQKLESGLLEQGCMTGVGNFK